MASGTIKSNNWKLVWTNPTPTSEFPAQTISLNLSTYSEIKLIIRASIENAGENLGFAEIPSTGFQVFWLASGIINSRAFSGITSTGITFNTGRKYTTYGNVTNDNNIGIPIRIYAK